MSVLFSSTVVQWGPHAMISILFFFYILQGIIGGYAAAMSIIYQENGISLSEQGTLSLISYPFSFKWIYAPFLDVYFVKKIGKRKTYLLISGLIMSLIFLVSFNKINQIVDDVNVIKFTIIMFIVYFFLSVNDVSIDAIANSVLPDTMVHHSSTAQTIGQMIGILFGYIGFTYMNSIDWLNTYIYTDNPVDEPLLTSRDMFIILGIYSFILTIFTLLFVYEPFRHDPLLKTPLDAYKLYAGFYQNKYLRYFIIWILLSNFGAYFVGGTLGYKFIDAGMSSETFVTISLLTYPISIGSNSFVACWVKRKIFLRLNNILNIIALPMMPIALVIYYHFDADTNYLQTVYKYLAIAAIGSILDNTTLLWGMYVSWSSVAEYSSTYKTFLYAMMNLSSSIPSTIVLKTVDYFPNYYVFCSIGITIQVVYVLISIKIAKFYDTLRKDSLHLKKEYFVAYHSLENEQQPMIMISSIFQNKQNFCIIHKECLYIQIKLKIDIQIKTFAFIYFLRKTEKNESLFFVLFFTHKSSSFTQNTTNLHFILHNCKYTVFARNI